MKKYFVLFLLSLACILISCNKKNSNENEKPSITVTNTSVVTLTADTVSFDVTIRERGTGVDKLTDSGNIKSNKVRKILENLGVKDFSSQLRGVTPYYSYKIIDKDKSAYDRDNEKKEYRYHEYLYVFNIKIKYADKRPEFTGKVIDEVLQVPNVEIGNLRYTISDNRKANATVRQSSAQAVMKKINSYAEGCGAEVKNIRRMYEGYYTRDTGVEMAAVATRNTMAVNAKQSMAFDMANGFYEEDTSTQIQSDKMSFSAEVDYSSYLAGRKDSILSVSGYSEVKTDPDIADFNFTVRLNGNDTAQLAKKSADIIKNICTRLDGNCELTSKYFFISPYFVTPSNESSSYHSDRANDIKYYELVHEISVRVRDFAIDNKLGRIIDLVKKDGSDYISIGGTNYSISDNSAYTAKARAGASANAKEKCQIYASGAGTKCTGVFSITERNSTQDTDIDGDELYYGAQGKKIYKGEEIQNGQTVIFRDKISVRAQLTVTADI